MRVVGKNVLYTSSIGIDVHKDMIVCCFGSPGEDNVIQNEVREFATNKKTGRCAGNATALGAAPTH